MSKTDTFDLVSLAGRIVRNVGREFPAPWQEMVERQYISMVEEGAEFRKALLSGDPDGIRSEIADCAITVGMMAHYLNMDQAALDDVEIASSSAPDLIRYPDLQGVIAELAGPTRRYLGIARRGGSREDACSALGAVMATVVELAAHHDIALTEAITAKTAVIFSRGWRDVSSR